MSTMTQLELLCIRMHHPFLAICPYVFVCACVYACRSQRLMLGFSFITRYLLFEMGCPVESEAR